MAYDDDESMRQRHPFPAALSIVLVLLTGCSIIREAHRSLPELQKVQQVVQHALGNSEIRVVLINGHILNVGVVNSPLKALPPVEKNAKRLEIARMAYDSYASRSALRSVNVTFAVHRNYLGIFNYDDSRDSFSFGVGQLADSAR
jgi:hypothetical protein